jgi:hypothetical protein
MVRYEKSNDSKIHSYYAHLRTPMHGQRHCQHIALNISSSTPMYLHVPKNSFGHTKQKCWFCAVIYSVAQSLVGILPRNNQACAQPGNVITRCAVYVHTNDATVMSLSRLSAKKEGQTLLPQRKLLLRYLGTGPTCTTHSKPNESNRIGCGLIASPLPPAHARQRSP